MAVDDLTKRKPRLWQTCATCDALANLPTAKATKLRDLLANDAIRYSELAHELATDPDWLLEIDWQALSRHARGICKARERLRGGRK